MKKYRFKQVKIKEKHFLKSRIFYMLLGVCGMFGILMIQFFKLQIVEQETHSEEVRSDTIRQTETEGIRGGIFDRYGKPLAINKPLYTLKLDQQVKMTKKELNAIILKVIHLLESNGDTYIDEIPLSKEAPFTFTEGESRRRLFINSIPFDGREHRDEILEYSPRELFDYLRSDKVFQIDESYTDEEARKIMAIRHQMYQVAYQKYKPITIATHISEKTLATISEHQDEYPNIYPEVDSYRYYTYGKEFGNVLGYTRKITSKQFEEMQELGYDKNDVIGQMGIEQTMEEELRGEKGKEIIEVDNVGRKVNVIENTPAKEGNDVFLTIDRDIQLKTYQAIEQRLAEAIVERLEGGARGVKPLKPREILVSMVESNQLSLEKMEKASEGTMQHELYGKLSKWFEEAISQDKYKEELKDMTLKEFLVLLLNQEENYITDRELLLVLSEQGSLKLEEQLIKQIWSGNYPALREILIQELKSGDLKPDQMAIDPFSASAVVVEVNTGNVLAVVGYPSYDSNEMTTNFNAYYSMLQDGIDKRNLLWNRALMTAKAPGSTFKMISALVGLDTGVVNTSTTINDSGPYTKAGAPYPKCWFYTNNGYGHGPADIYRALEVSCNYYFYELAYRLGLKYGEPYGAIDLFSEYASEFGLDQKTGIELDEVAPNVSNPYNLINSNISKSLNVIRKVSEEGQKVFDKLFMDLVSEGIYPYERKEAQDFKGKLEYKIGEQIKKEVDALFQESSKVSFNAVSKSLINDFKKVLEAGVTEHAQRLTNDILLDTTKGSMKAKTKGAVREFLESLVSAPTYELILEEISKIEEDEIQYIYEKAFTNLLKGKALQEFDKEEQENIRQIVKDIEVGKIDSRQWLAERIQANLIEELVDYLFESVDLEWTNALNVRTAIGQGNNAFTPLQIGRYIAALANGKEVFDLKVVGGITDNKEGREYSSLPDKHLKALDLNQDSLDVVYEGMYRVVNGREGSARHAFADSQVVVAGKTGTAEEAKHEHSWFAGFAPYDKPEIAVVTAMYTADGLGKYNYLLANDIFNAILVPTQEDTTATMKNVFVD